MTKHSENCTAPICIDDENQDAVWYAGEEICSKRPMVRCQKIQTEINKFTEIGKFKFIDTPFTRWDLENKSI